MSITFQTTPSQFQPVLSDGIYFTLSSSTYSAITTFKFKYKYELYVEGALVFEGKCSPNPFGLGIVDLQQILETYTDSLPISYWDTTPIYTHQTFPFSRPANDEVIGYYLKLGYEYADSEISPVSGFTGYGNAVGAPSVETESYKVFRSTMGTNPRATQQSFDIGPFVLSGTPQGTYPTTSGLFLTNAPRILDIQETDYFTLGFTNYYLWSGATSGFSEGYYVEYNFYDEDGVLLSATTYDNITTNGGGPRTNCNLVYQNLYLIEPVSAATDWNTLYVGAGPANFPEIPNNTKQYTVQLFGKFTGSTTPIQPSPTPTPTPGLSPTPTPTPSSTPAGYCSGCTEYQLYWSGESLASVSIVDCATQNTLNIALTPGLYYNICSCEFPIAELPVEIFTGGPCLPPSPSPTPSPTPECVCSEYLVENATEFTDYLQYIECFNNTPQVQELGPFQATTLCCCTNTLEYTYSTVSYLNPCIFTPSPTPTPTKSPTPTPSNTPGCFIEWMINECVGGTCSGGICACEGSTPVTVYTNCSVIDITDPDTEIYDTSALISPWTGDFIDGGSIWNSTGANVVLVCVVGGPC